MKQKNGNTVHDIVPFDAKIFFGESGKWEIVLSDGTRPYISRPDKGFSFSLYESGELLATPSVLRMRKKKIKHAIWINLYSTGASLYAGQHSSELEARAKATKDLVETRKIEWEVNHA